MWRKRVRRNRRGLFATANTYINAGEWRRTSRLVNSVKLGVFIMG